MAEKGTVHFSKKKVPMLHHISKKGIPVVSAIPAAAKYFRDADVTDGISALFEIVEGRITKVTIEGKEEIDPRQSLVSNPHASAQSRSASQPARRTIDRGYPPRVPARRNATAPFNFIPADQVALGFVPPTSDTADVTLYGRISCTLKALSPLLVAGPQGRTLDEAPTRREFFKLNQKPVIPGSSLKGMLRTTLECLSLAPLAPVSDRKIPYRGVGDDEQKIIYNALFIEQIGRDLHLKPKVKAAFLEIDGADVKLTPCEWARVPYSVIGDYFGGRSDLFATLADKASRISVADRRINDYYALEKLNEWHSKTGDRPIGFDLDPNQWHGAGGSSRGMMHFYNLVRQFHTGGTHTGTLVFTGHVPRKSKDYIFYNPLNQKLVIDYDVYREFLEQMSKKQRSYWERLNELRKGRIPIFYLEDVIGLPKHLGLAQLFRVPSMTYPESLVGLDLSDPNRPRDVCQCIFGYVEGKGGRRGRVAINPASLRHGMSIPMTYAHVVTGDPNPSCAALYLIQPDSVSCRVSGRNITNQVRGYNNSESALRGKKLYWHRDPNVPQPPNNNPAMQSIYCPLQSGVEFSFSLDFEGLSRVELGGLLEAIDLPKGHAHKLGLGKPFGFGSVRITIDQLEAWEGRRAYQDLGSRLRGQRTSQFGKDDVESLKEKFRKAITSALGVPESEFESLNAIKSFRRMSDFEQRPANVRTEYMALSTPDTERPSYKWKSVLPNVLDI
ncbi:MAG: TIGR03986 family CRISPR-associated RAMP protein [Candidatus Hydrogenedentes bacterium]|nr:TIGR03986 family CRISPR-associated RAMP protein [Candidatus Hydrogenedentota bacterium]